MLFSVTLLMSILMIITSNSWFLTWIFLEINTLSFITLSFYLNQEKKQENMMKYFIIQSCASLILLSSLSTQQNSYLMTWFTLSILMKLGAFPFHSWFISLMSKMSWKMCFILSTIQKLPPFILLFQISPNMNFKIISLLNGIMSSFTGIIQTNLKKILGFSSLMHLSWMLYVVNLNINLILIYFTIYSINTMMIMILFNNMKINKINNLNNIKSNYMKIQIMILLLNLSGMPPMLGFLGKLIIILNLHLNFSIIILLMLSAISMFFYIKIMIPNFMNSTEQYINTKMNNIYNLMILFSFSSFPFYSMLF